MNVVMAASGTFKAADVTIDRIKFDFGLKRQGLHSWKHEPWELMIAEAWSMYDALSSTTM